MKAIFINVETQTVEFVEIQPGLHAIYEKIGNDCHMVECPIQYENGDLMYCDEEGYFKKQTGGFYYPDWATPITGNALIIGTDSRNGNSISCKSKLEDFQAGIKFLQSKIMNKIQEIVENTPPTIISW